MKKYVDGPGFSKIKDSKLQAQLIDFGVNSGPSVAVRKLQKILNVPEDGVLGFGTLAALEKAHPWEDVNNLLVAARVRMIGKVIYNNPSQLRFINGWLDRALQFME
jgi:lysozyme family protein